MNEQPLNLKRLHPTRHGRTAHGLLAALAIVALLLLLSVLLPLVWQALPALTAPFLWGEGQGAIGPEVLNTLSLVGGSELLSFPLALLVALYRVEWVKSQGPLLRVFDQFATTMLSVPSIVIGLVVVDVAIARWHWPISTMTGIVALALMNWPLSVAYVVEALQQIPGRYREGSWALGASRWQTVRYLILPLAWPQMVEQAGLATARLMGETAVLIYTAGVNAAVHWSLWGPGESLAVHLWLLRTEGVGQNAQAQAAATGVVLLAFVVLVLWGSKRMAQWLKNA
ncbi:MAG: phosphate ABC transporter permease [Sulfobacillus thermosulfidooxidans]|nr:MAG: phosphate ABC transporter permease [Sulfobacillus thermosulfidooxidans]